MIYNIYINMDIISAKIERFYINMSKIKKSVTISKDIADKLSQISKKLEITENSIISIAILEYYNKVRSSL